jgi:hypothetical protein
LGRERDENGEEDRIRREAGMSGGRCRRER